MKFLGLTDEWNRSICLFHKMFGGEISDIELRNIRPSGAKDDVEKTQFLMRKLKESGFKDDDDLQIFRLVEKIVFELQS